MIITRKKIFLVFCYNDVGSLCDYLTNTSENSPTSTGGEMNRFFVDFVMDEQYKICYNIFSNKYKKESKYQ